MVDYSVWDHIEVSDDEDETHPNIDTASLFRWRHQVARVRPSPSPPSPGTPMQSWDPGGSRGRGERIADTRDSHPPSLDFQLPFGATL